MSVSAVKSGDVYRIRTAINTITSEGTCTLKLQKNGGELIEKIAGVQAQPSNSVCKGFDIQLTDLSPGTWTLTVDFFNNDVKGSATTTEEI